MIVRIASRISPHVRRLFGVALQRMNDRAGVTQLFSVCFPQVLPTPSHLNRVRSARLANCSRERSLRWLISHSYQAVYYIKCFFHRSAYKKRPISGSLRNQLRPVVKCRKKQATLASVACRLVADVRSAEQASKAPVAGLT
jgi:hypothetical protein